MFNNNTHTNDTPTNTKKHKGGRPKALNPKNARVTIMLTQEQRNEFDARAKQQQMSTSEAARLLILNEKIPEKIYGGLNVDASKLYMQLQPLQSNLNQLAAKFNTIQIENATREQTTQVLRAMNAAAKVIQDFRNEVINSNHPNIETDNESGGY